MAASTQLRLRFIAKLNLEVLDCLTGRSINEEYRHLYTRSLVLTKSF